MKRKIKSQYVIIMLLVIIVVFQRYETRKMKNVIGEEYNSNLKDMYFTLLDISTYLENENQYNSEVIDRYIFDLENIMQYGHEPLGVVRIVIPDMVENLKQIKQSVDNTKYSDIGEVKNNIDIINNELNKIFKSYNENHIKYYELRLNAEEKREFEQKLLSNKFR